MHTAYPFLLLLDVVLAAQASSALLTLQDSGGATSLLVTNNSPKKTAPAKAVVNKSAITPKKPNVPTPGMTYCLILSNTQGFLVYIDTIRSRHHFHGGAVFFASIDFLCAA